MLDPRRWPLLFTAFAFAAPLTALADYSPPPFYDMVGFSHHASWLV